MMEFNTHALVDLSGVTQKTLSLIYLLELWYQVLIGLIDSLTHGIITVTQVNFGWECWFSCCIDIAYKHRRLSLPPPLPATTTTTITMTTTCIVMPAYASTRLRPPPFVCASDNDIHPLLNDDQFSFPFPFYFYFSFFWNIPLTAVFVNSHLSLSFSFIFFSISIFIIYFFLMKNLSRLSASP
jgi:hypothetical protein